METLKKCRVCLKENLVDAVSFIQEAPEHDLLISDLYQYVTGYSMVDRNGPQDLCRECLASLSSAYLFKKRCDETEKMYEKVLVEIKEEIIEPEVDIRMFRSEAEEEVDEIGIKEEISDINNSKNVIHKTRQKSHKCSSCDEKFEKESHLRKHRQRKHRHQTNAQSKEKTLCPHCGKTLKFSSLASHIEMIHEKSDAGVYICDFCGNNYNSKISITNHLRYQHMKKGPIVCRYCPESFANDGSRRYHEVTIHTKDYKHVCSLCGMKCYNSAIYNRHLTSHTGEKPFMCTQCGARFGRKNTLSNHIATHTDEKKFICKICSAAFKTVKSLKTHQNVHEERKYECPVCQQKFLVNQSMRIHCIRQHPDYKLPPPGTIMNKQALKRMQEMSLKRPQYAIVTPDRSE